jgi:hypothetical protein
MWGFGGPGSYSSDYMWHKQINRIIWLIQFLFYYLRMNIQQLTVPWYTFSCITHDRMLCVLSPFMKDKIKAKEAFFSLWIQLYSWQGEKTKKNSKNISFCKYVRHSFHYWTGDQMKGFSLSNSDVKYNTKVKSTNLNGILHLLLHMYAYAQDLGWSNLILSMK